MVYDFTGCFWVKGNIKINNLTKIIETDLAFKDLALI